MSSLVTAKVMKGQGASSANVIHKNMFSQCVCVCVCSCVKPSAELVHRGSEVSPTDDSAPVSVLVGLISQLLQMLPIRIRAVGTHLAKASDPATPGTSVD